MPRVFPPLIVFLAALMIDAAIELSLISSMVSWLHKGLPSGTLSVIEDPLQLDISPVVQLRGEPANLLVDQGHTSNGAAGTALVLIGFGGILALTLRQFWWTSTTSNSRRRIARIVYYIWLGLQIPALLLTIGALGYTFSITNQHSDQSIDPTAVLRAAQSGSKYPVNQWTPRNWFEAVLKHVQLADRAQRQDIVRHLRLVRGWQYNLIPLFLVQTGETGMAVWDYLWWRKREGQTGQAGQANGSSKA